MLILGITGSLGTGKTTVAHLFAKRGAKVLDADKIAHNLMQSTGRCFRPVVRTFGRDILTKGKIDRKKLSAIVFDHPKKLKKLCAIIHPPVIQEIKRKITRYQKMRKVKAVAIDAPLLIEAGLHKMVDYLIVVKANHNLQIKRISKCRPIKKSEAIKRIKNQMSILEKIRCADIVIDNKGSFEQTKKQVEAIWLRLLKRNRKK